MTIQKILLVDDSKTELHYLSELLGKRGYAVRTAENGEEAMRRLGEDTPDLILMDVVMLSSKDGVFDKARGRMVGSQDYLTKPFTKDQLLQAVEQFGVLQSEAS